jgi:hypothetical protein
VQLYLFDLLHHGPDSLLGLPYTERRDRLEALGLDADPVRTPPWYRDEAHFSGGEINFDRGQFSGQVNFGGAEFFGGKIHFLGAVFSGGLVSFNRAQFSGGEINFDGALFSSGSEVKFNGASFCGGQVDLKHALFSGGRVTFVNPELWSHPRVFGWDGEPPPGVVLPARQGPFSPREPSQQT